MRKATSIIVVLGILILLSSAFLGIYFTKPSQPSSNSTSPKIQVVAAENFWGSLISQLGGTRVQVTSIVTDPNADPHEYENNSANAQAVANANLVVVNGAGYDTWALHIIAAGGNSDQIVLNVQELLGQAIDANPHFWYSPYYVNDTLKAMYNDLVAIDPADAGYFNQQYTILNASLGPYNQLLGEIKQQYSGVPVAATEDIFECVANATGLNLVSPSAFMQAVSEGNEPPAQSIAQFQELMQNRSVSVLVYNAQTLTPLTENIKTLATQNGIPIVAITETIQPPNVSFQDWMYAEMSSLQNALNSSNFGH